MPMTGRPKRPEIEPEEADTPEQEAAGQAAAAADDADPQALLAELRQKADENWDLYLRAVAEADNVRKRAARDVEHARKYALENFATELLAVRDSLEIGLAAASSADAEALVAGNEATLKLLTTILERFGVTEVDPLGEPFDPQLHEAMTVQPSTEAEPGSVLTVIQKGYSLNGRLLRPARVIVAAEAVADQGPA
jgi:molecular chaperone GrpE